MYLLEIHQYVKAEFLSHSPLWQTKTLFALLSRLHNRLQILHGHHHRFSEAFHRNADQILYCLLILANIVQLSVHTNTTIWFSPKSHTSPTYHTRQVWPQPRSEGCPWTTIDRRLAFLTVFPSMSSPGSFWLLEHLQCVDTIWEGAVIHPGYPLKDKMEPIAWLH